MEALSSVESELSSNTEAYNVILKERDELLQKIDTAAGALELKNQECLELNSKLQEIEDELSIITSRLDNLMVIENAESRSLEVWRAVCALEILISVIIITLILV